MQTLIRSLPGTIRDNNQDVVLVSNSPKLALIVDGAGKEGRVIAEFLADNIKENLLKKEPTIDSREAHKILLTVVNNSLNADPEKFAYISLCALWIIRSHVAAVFKAPCKVEGFETSSEAFSDNKFNACLQTLKVGQKFIIYSEGVNLCRSDAEIIELKKRLLSDNCECSEGLEKILKRAREIYDGDDVSIVLVTTEKQDGLYAREIVLETHFDKSFSFSLWVPVVIVFSALLSALPFIKKAFYLYRRVSKTF